MTQQLNPNQALWEKGDFTRIAATMRGSGEELVRRLGIQPGQKVLDLGCGDGTTAIPAALGGAEVTGIDIAENLVAAGNMRVRELGLTNCRFQQGDASRLDGVPDHSFDTLISIFGAMFAPRPYEVAQEMVRVVKPGGKIMMGNWIPNDPTLVAQILKISSAYSPAPPEGFVSPMLWGVEEHVVDRFAKAAVPEGSVSFSRETWEFSFPGWPSEFVAEFRNFYGPTMNAFAAAEMAGRERALQADLEDLFSSQNKSPRRGATLISATYLCVTVSV